MEIIDEVLSDPFIKDFVDKHQDMLDICKCSHQKLLHFLKPKFFLRVTANGCKLCVCKKYEQKQVKKI